MGIYKYKILEDDRKYYFALFPNNSNTQVMGQSILYASECECQCALKEFQTFMILNKIDSLDSEYVSIMKEESGFRYEIRENGKVIFYRQNAIETKGNLQNNLVAIYKNINADLIN